MPNIASVLKDEIPRDARKEIRGETASLKKALSAYRTDLATLKHRAQALEQELKRARKSSPKASPASTGEPSSKSIRFSAKGLLSQRKRLGLSAEDCGLLVGASGQSVYNWQGGKSRPREMHLAAIAVLKSMGKKEVARRLSAHREG
jgi:DNA-binding transcriptional regulator YiaG